MAEFTLKPRSIFEAVGGCRIEMNGLVFDEAPARSLVSLARRRGAAGEALEKGVGRGLGLDLPAPGRLQTISDLTIMFSQPGQWLISGDRDDLEESVRAAAGAAGTVTNQSDAFTELLLEGALSMEVLSRLSSLDFERFEVGAVARTPMQQIAVIVARTGTESFRLNTARSTARDFAHDVAVAAKSVAARGAIA